MYTLRLKYKKTAKCNYILSNSSINTPLILPDLCLQLLHTASAISLLDTLNDALKSRPPFVDESDTV